MRGGLILFDGEKAIGSVLLDEDVSGFGLGVQGVEADHAPVEIEFVERGCRRRGFR